MIPDHIQHDRTVITSWTAQVSKIWNTDVSLPKEGNFRFWLFALQTCHNLQDFCFLSRTVMALNVWTYYFCLWTLDSPYVVGTYNTYVNGMGCIETEFWKQNNLSDINSRLMCCPSDSFHPLLLQFSTHRKAIIVLTSFNKALWMNINIFISINSVTLHYE